MQQVKFKYLELYSLVTEDGTRRLIYGSKQTQFCVSFVARCSQNGSFQTLQCFQFINQFLFRSSPMVMNLGGDWKSAILSKNGRDEIFAKISRRDVSRQSAQLWNFWSPKRRASFLRIEQWSLNFFTYLALLSNKITRFTPSTLSDVRLLKIRN